MTDRLLALSFFVPGDPRSKARPRVTRNGAFTPKATRDAEQNIAAEFRYAFPRHIPFDGHLSLHVEFFMATKRRVDTENLFKLVADALNGVAYVDDSQIIKLSAERRPAIDDEIAGTWIVIEPLEGAA